MVPPIIFVDVHCSEVRLDWRRAILRLDFSEKEGTSAPFCEHALGPTVPTQSEMSPRPLVSGLLPSVPLIREIFPDGGKRRHL